MKLFGNKKVEYQGSKIPRIANLSDADLRSWFDSAVMNLGSHFDSWRYQDGPPGEVDTILEALTELWAEIKERENG